jgi:hypothetical protein
MILLSSGLIVTAISWAIAWSTIPVLSAHSFFPLWVGYILTVNGISEVMVGDSLMRRMRFSFLVLFVASVPFWWFFELVNSIVQNWHYQLPAPISALEYGVRASISFSTVIPAVLSTTFLSHHLLKRKNWSFTFTPIQLRRGRLMLSVLVGMLSLLLLARVPQIAFPLVWIAPLLVLEPTMYALKYPSLLRRIAAGEWCLPTAIMGATLFNGFWWEFWNFYAMPKWVYTIPYLGFWKVFEMPILGYLGYPFFGLIVYSYAMFICSGLIGRQSADDLISASDRRGTE